MKLRNIAIAFAIAAMGLTSCDDDVSEIGSSLSKGEITITVDSLVHKLEARPEYLPEFDARTSSNLLGRLSIPAYGDLKCSFVSQLLPSVGLGIPDSIGVSRIDSLSVVIKVKRGNLTGDSLAPQQLKLYALEKSLPAGLTNKFDPQGYYDPSKPLGTRTYTLTALAKKDTAFFKDQYIDIPIKLDDSYAKQLFEAYKTNPGLFAWPSTFEKKYHGIYVEQTFGRGCVANINSLNFYLYYHYPERKSQIVDSEVVYTTVTKRDSVSLFTIAPEVTSSNCISYTPGETLRSLEATGTPLLSSPGGYVTHIKFPADDIIAEYRSHDSSLGVVSGLSMSIPAQPIDNSHGIQVPPMLLMVKSSEMEAFFNENKIPDDKTSFWALYDKSTGRYDFSSMREYILNVMESGKTPTEDDMAFTLVPVNISIEKETNPYTGVVTTYVTRCAPYMAAPTMAKLDTDNAVVIFTYSTQTMK